MSRLDKNNTDSTTEGNESELKKVYTGKTMNQLHIGVV